MKTLACLCVSICFAAACSGPPKGAIEVPNVPGTDSSARSAPSNVTLSVSQLRDGRPVNPRTNTSGNVVFPEGNVGAAVERSIEESLTKKGMIVTHDSPINVTGEILRWQSDVRPGLPKKVESNAEIFVEVRSEGGKKLYEGTFTGEQKLEEGAISKEDVQESLAEAMQEAVGRVVSDRDFLEAVWTNSQVQRVGRLDRRPTEIR